MYLFAGQPLLLNSTNLNELKQTNSEIKFIKLYQIDLKIFSLEKY